MRIRTAGSFSALAFLAACAGATRSGDGACPSIAAPASTSNAAPAKSDGRTLPPLDATLIRTLAATRGFRLGAPVLATPTPGGQSILFLRSGARDAKQSLFELDVATGETKQRLTPDDVSKTPETLSPEEKIRRERLRISASGFTGFEIAKGGGRVLLTLSGRIFLLDRATSAVRELPTPKSSPAFDPHLSPDGTRVAYVRDHDVRVMSLDAKDENDEVSVTAGGTEDAPHGEAEFVAQEELDRTRGFWWSPDGASIAFEAYDATKVERLTIVDPAHPEAAQVIRYPRAGTTNATVKLALAPVPKKGAPPTPPTSVGWDATKLPYLARVVWSAHAPLSVVVLSRDQRDLSLLTVDEKTGKTGESLHEHDDAFLENDATTPAFLGDGSFLWSARRQDVWRLELHDVKGKLVRSIGAPDLHYHEIVDVDRKSQRVRFLASWQPTESQLFEATLADGKTIELTPKESFVLSARASEDHVAWVAGTSTIEAARSTTAHVGSKSVVVPSVAESPPPLHPVELANVGPEAMRVAVVRPHDFDPKKRYPVIDAAYGGPGFRVVSLDGAAYVRMQWLADACRAVVVGIDSKGTPHRGRAWEAAIAKAFGRVPLEGHVAALHALATTHPEIDLARVGVYGWSFGGYFSAMAVLRAPDLYGVAVVGAPVADWRDYDTTYTERYMGMPQDDATAYDDASLLTWARRPIDAKSPARPMLVFHGTADDNVFFLNSLKLVDALENSQRPFEFVPLEGITHQLASPDAAEVVWTKTAIFLRDLL